MKYKNISSLKWQKAGDYATSLGYEPGKQKWWEEVREYLRKLNNKGGNYEK